MARSEREAFGLPKSSSRLIGCRFSRAWSCLLVSAHQASENTFPDLIRQVLGDL
jgi:hypothetical protein